MTAKEKSAFSKWWATTSPEYRKQRTARQREGRKQVLAALRLYKAERGCKDCGERDPIVLELDHRVQSEKRFSLGRATGLGWSIERVMAEAAKCDVRCANCHRRKTAVDHWRL